MKHPTEEWEWFGNHGHFICGQWCRFHITTRVGPWLVSTIGEYTHPRFGKGSETEEAKWINDNWPGEQIGLDRFYETMVFKAGKVCDQEDCGCGLPSISGQEIDFRGYMVAKDATKGHMAMCRKFSEREAE